MKWQRSELSVMDFVTEHLGDGGGRMHPCRMTTGPSGSETEYLHADALETTTAMTNQSDTLEQDSVYLPWGDELASSGSRNAVFFAGMRERDGVTQLDRTPARDYSSALGRWLSPDPLGGDIMNPQSLDRYAYVTDNPTTFTDPLGLCKATGQPGPCSMGPPNGGSPVNDVERGAESPCDGVSFDPLGFPLCHMSSEIAASLAAYESWVAATEAIGGTYTRQTPRGPLAYTIDWGVGDGVFWSGPNGEPLFSAEADEIDLPSLPGTVVPFSSSGCLGGPCPQLRTPLRALLPGTNYCGPGGNGKAPTNSLDAGWQAHDYAFYAAGMSFKDTIPPWSWYLSPAQVAAMNVANQHLCADIAGIPPEELLANPGETAEVGAVSGWFGCGP